MVTSPIHTTRLKIITIHFPYQRDHIYNIQYLIMSSILRTIGFRNKRSYLDGDDDGDYDYAPAAFLEGDDDDNDYDYAPPASSNGDDDDGDYDYAPAASLDGDDDDGDNYNYAPAA